MLFLVIFSMVFGNVLSPDPRKHDSKSVVDPDEIFLMSNSTLGDNGDSTVPYAIYQNASIVDGPLSHTYAVQFTGGDSSYMDLENTDGAFNGIDAFTWGFYIYPNNTLTEARTIMTYNGPGSGDGCELIQNGAHLEFKFTGYLIENSTGIVQTTGTNVSEHIVVSESDIALTTQWMFITVSFSAYNNFVAVQQVEAGDDIKDKQNLQSYGDEQYVFANAIGNIRFGNSFSGDTPFLGSISCIQFKQMSLLKTSIIGLEPKCDPSTWVDHGILGRVKPLPIQTTTSTTSTTPITSTTSTTSSTTSTASSTTTTTSSSTTSSTTSTLSPTTSTLPPTTSSLLLTTLPTPPTTVTTLPTTVTTSSTTVTTSATSTTPTSSSVSTTVSSASVTSDPTATVPNLYGSQQTQFSYDVIERCQHFTLRNDDITYSNSLDILDTAWVSDLKSCTEQCLRNNDCTTFVISSPYLNGYMCYTGVTTLDTKHEHGAKFYSVHGS